MGVLAWEGQDLGQVKVGEVEGQSADRFWGGDGAGHRPWLEPCHQQRL